MNCVIAANGDLKKTGAVLAALDSADLVIAADGGATRLMAMDITPHVIIGDLDSISPEARQFFKNRGIRFFVHPVQKDQTDTELAIDHALDCGASRITLIGVTGTRLDHTLANILLLRPLTDRGIPACILDSHNEIHLATRYLALEGKPGDLLSVVPVSGQVRGLSIDGVAYPLDNACLTMGTSLGISNCFKEERAVIRLESGAVVVTRSWD